ncbi:MAG: 2-methylaconitate cis-trans isomerase PrpF [Rubrivivax sp.]
MPQVRIAATVMRGGTSKGVFFRLQDLPEAAQVPGAARDALLLRVLGSPDPYGQQIDGMGGATSSTSKAVILSKSSRSDHDVDFLFAQVAIDRPLVDYSGNCGNLSAAVGPFALRHGFVDAQRVPNNGLASVRIWQANIGKTIVAHVPVRDGQVQECGDFELDGVTFPAAEVQLEFVDPAGDETSTGAMFPTGHLIDELVLSDGLLPGGALKATLINAGIATVFVDARAVGCTGTEGQDTINGDAKALARFEAIRAAGALRMGLIDELREATKRQHTPKLVLVAPPALYTTASGKVLTADDVDLLARALSMGKLHHAMMGTAAVAIAVAAAIPGTVVNLAAGGGERHSVRFGHPSGSLRVGAKARRVEGGWQVDRVVVSRSARVLMDGWVHVSGDIV